MVRASAKETNPDGGGNFITAPCRGQFCIDDVKVETKDGKIQVVVKSQCVSGNAPEQIGRSNTSYYDVDGPAAGKFFQLCYATGLITKEEWRSCKDAGIDRDIDETQLESRPFCGEVREDVYNGKTRYKLDFRLWRHDDPEAKGCVLDPVTCQVWSIPIDANGLFVPPPSTNGSGNGQTTPPSTPPAAAVTPAKPPVTAPPPAQSSVAAPAGYDSLF